MLFPISYALQRGILLRRENPTHRYWAPVVAATRGFKMVLFTASRGNNFVGGTCVQVFGNAVTAVRRMIERPGRKLYAYTGGGIKYLTTHRNRATIVIITILEYR